MTSRSSSSSSQYNCDPDNACNRLPRTLASTILATLRRIALTVFMFCSYVCLFVFEHYKLETCMCRPIGIGIPNGLRAMHVRIRWYRICSERRIRLESMCALHSYDRCHLMHIHSYYYCYKHYYAGELIKE